MGKRGPQPKPTTLKILAGNPGRRPLNEREPKPTRGIPSMPKWLTKRARVYWPDITATLDAMGVLTVADQIAVALFCEALADFVDAGKVVEAAARRGSRFVARTEKGNVIQHPAVGVMHTAWEHVLKVAREFGLTAASRTGLKVEPPRQTDKWQKALLGS